MYSCGWAAPATQSVASAATGGATAPLPSKTASAAAELSTSGSAAATFVSNGGAGHAAAAAPAADGRHAGEDRVLEAVGGGVPPRPRGGEQVGDVERLAARHDLGLRRPAAAHGDDDHAALAAEAVVEQARQVAGDGRLADALAGPDHVERRHAAQRQTRRRRRR